MLIRLCGNKLSKSALSMKVTISHYLGRAKNLLKTNNLKALKGCINLIQDNEGIIYRVPNFCINQPYFEKEIAKLDKIQGINSKTLHVIK